MLLQVRVESFNFAIALRFAFPINLADIASFVKMASAGRASMRTPFLELK
jgi:hypothetical protein